MIETLENGVKDGPWLLGDKFSAADVLVGSSAYFMKQFGMLPQPVAGSFDLHDDGMVKQSVECPGSTPSRPNWLN